MNRGAWQATAHKVTESQTGQGRLSTAQRCLTKNEMVTSCRNYCLIRVSL